MVIPVTVDLGKRETMPPPTISKDSSTPAPPDEFVCQLSLKLGDPKVMKDPVVSRYGYHFEREAIVSWINDGNNYCPISGNPLRLQNLVSDATLKWKIQYWARKQGLEVESIDDSPDTIDYSHMFGGVTFAIPPSRFLCALTKEIMENPMISKTGQNFERSVILKYLDEVGDVCPVTKEPLNPSGLVPNDKLKWEIGQWQLHHGDPTKEMSRLELETKLSKAEMVSRDFHISDILKALTDVEGDAANGEEKEAHPDDAKPAAKKPDMLDVLEDIVDVLE